MSNDPQVPMLQGDRFRATHRATVVAILGADAPRVISKGARFYNIDRWTVRHLTKQMCDWAKANPGCVPTRVDVSQWVHRANAERVERDARCIVIATTPAKLSIRTALALVGGGNHEAFHTKYSCRRDLTVEEVAAIVLPRWAKVADWSKLYGLLQDWGNIVEDIRIERRGNEDYPGIYAKMCELQDFILLQEDADRQKTLAIVGPEPLKKPLPIVSGMFRDLGLGYPTDLQDIAYQGYRERNPDAVAIVESGPLRPILEEAINLTAFDDTGCLRVAMDALVELSQLVDPDDMKKANEQAEGSSGKPKCPKCGAPGKDLVCRPLSNGQGGKVKGKGVITCTKCGWQEIVDVSAAKPSKGQGKPDPEDAIKFEDMPEMPGQQGQDNDEGGGKGKSKDKKEKGEKGSSGSGKGDGEEGEEGEGSSGGGSGKKSEDGGDADGEGEGAGEDEEDADGEGDGDEEDGGEEDGGESEGGGAGDEGGDNDEGGGSDSHTDGSQSSDSDGHASGAGGHQWDPEKVKGVAEEILSDAAKGDTAGLRDAGSALEQAFENVREREDKDCADDEMPWRPWNPGLDTVQFVEPSLAGIGNDRAQSKVLLDSVKAESSYLRARLRAIVRAVEQRAVIHGVRKGRDLSERMLVDSVATLRSGHLPSRAYSAISDQIDTSLAAVLIIDQSSSMGWPKSKLQDATRVLMALTEPLDSLGAAVLAAGFRDGEPDPSGANWSEIAAGGYHRNNGICHDVFKSFDEKFTAVRWRFANTRAVGGTPMSDGVQFGLDCLSTRHEAHRVLFIITDGEPNGGHAPVIRRQVRLAKKSGINVIGVGIGTDSKAVMTLFPDHVWAENISDMPKALLAKLNVILDYRGLGRGRPLAKSG